VIPESCEVESARISEREVEVDFYLHLDISLLTPIL